MADNMAKLEAKEMAMEKTMAEKMLAMETEKNDMAKKLTMEKFKSIDYEDIKIIPATRFFAGENKELQLIKANQKSAPIIINRELELIKANQLNELVNAEIAKRIANGTLPTGGNGKKRNTKKGNGTNNASTNNASTKTATTGKKSNGASNALVNLVNCLKGHNKPVKMAIIKKQLGNSYYELIKKNSHIIGKTETKEFYLIKNG
jgi:hypothetical protein